MSHATASDYDLEEICKLYDIFYKEMAILQPKYIRSARQNKYNLKDIIASDMADILIATEDEKIVGFALVQQQKTPPCSYIKPYDFAYLADLVIHPDFRGRGIGTHLIDAVKQWALDRLLEYVELSVIAENIGAIELYNRSGFVSTGYTMRAHL